MNGKFEPGLEASGPNEIKVSSSKGIRFRKEGYGRVFLDIPNNLVKSLIIDGKISNDAINRLHGEVFDGASVMWGLETDDFYIIELGNWATQEQIQRLIDKIEKANEEKN